MNWFDCLPGDVVFSRLGCQTYVIGVKRSFALESHVMIDCFIITKDYVGFYQSLENDNDVNFGNGVHVIRDGKLLQ